MTRFFLWIIRAPWSLLCSRSGNFFRFSTLGHNFPSFRRRPRQLLTPFHFGLTHSLRNNPWFSRLSTHQWEKTLPPQTHTHIHTHTRFSSDFPSLCRFPIVRFSFFAAKFSTRLLLSDFGFVFLKIFLFPIGWVKFSSSLPPLLWECTLQAGQDTVLIYLADVVSGTLLLLLCFRS